MSETNVSEYPMIWILTGISVPFMHLGLSLAPYFHLDKHKSHLLWPVLKNMSTEAYPLMTSLLRSLRALQRVTHRKHEIVLRFYVWSDRLNITFHCFTWKLQKDVSFLCPTLELLQVYLSLRDPSVGLCSNWPWWYSGGQMGRYQWTVVRGWTEA